MKIATKKVLTALAGAAFLGAVSTQAQQLVWTYDTDLTTTTNPVPMNWGPGWGAGGTIVWSPMDANGNPDSGSVQVTPNFSPGNTYDVLQVWGATLDLSPYNDFSIDIYMPPGATNLSPNGDYGTMNMRFRTGGNWPGVVLNLNGGNPITNSGWNHYDVPFPTLGIPPTPAWNLEWDTSYTNPATFNIDNVRFYYNSTLKPPPPPTLSLSSSVVSGLNVIAGSDGNSFYDRQQVRLTNTAGVAWVGHATTANPVKYAYTIKSFNSASYGNAANGFAGQYAYLFLIPNGAVANSPDYNNAAGCQIFVIQASPTNAILQFQYKVNLPNGNDMYYGRNLYTNVPGSWDGVTTPWYESGNLGGVTNYASSSPAVGTWTIEFTSDTNLTLIAPNGNAASYVIPAYNISAFTADDNFGIYLGNMAQTQQGLNQDIIYSSFAVTGVPSSYNDNFVADDGILSPEWDPSTSADQSCVFLLGSSAVHAATWTVSKGYWFLEAGSNLLQMTNWQTLSTYPAISEVNQFQQFIDKKDLPAGNQAFFNLKESYFTQLQVLLPGETNAPGTLAGKVGTPLPVSLSADYGEENITVNACDSNWHILNGVTDTISLTTTDASALTPGNAALVNGTITFGVTGVTLPLVFGTVGSWTVTASDISVTNVPPATSSSVTVVP